MTSDLKTKIELNSQGPNTVHIIGAGVAGLFCADLLLGSGHIVHLYDHQSGPGKKFLVAGNGGLNLTHSEDLDTFVTRYGKNDAFFRKALGLFSPTDLRDWCQGLGVETFVGTSGRVFPTKLKAAEILLTLRKRLEDNPKFHFHLKNKLTNIKRKNTSNELVLEFEGPQGYYHIEPQKVIFALGGGSWKKTGSDGLWVEIFKELGIEVVPLLPMNCGFTSSWSSFFKEKVERLPLKNVELKFQGVTQRTEVMVTDYGIEGTGVYAISNLIRDEILKQGKASLYLDLKPDLSPSELEEKARKSLKKKDSVNNTLRKAFGLNKDTITFLREFISQDEMNSLSAFIPLLKEIEVILTGVRLMDEAISTSGGIPFDSLCESLESLDYPGVFFVGEMLDFEAPTGGYLIQGAMSSAYVACHKIMNS